MGCQDGSIVHGLVSNHDLVRSSFETLAMEVGYNLLLLDDEVVDCHHDEFRAGAAISGGTDEWICLRGHLN